MDDVQNRVVAFYSDYLNADLSQLSSIYAPSVTFIDPLHEVYGLEKLHRYFESSKNGLTKCHFDFTDTCQAGNTLWLEWVMRYSHRKLKNGRPLTLHGSSMLTLENDLVVKQRDYYDLGEMLYEQIPLLGRLIKSLRRNVVEAVS
jgi:hypothetical protein